MSWTSTILELNDNTLISIEVNVYSEKANIIIQKGGKIVASHTNLELYEIGAVATTLLRLINHAQHQRLKLTKADTEKTRPRWWRSLFGGSAE